jgi:sugar/nucleoside kinase (ribokinase family)
MSVLVVGSVAYDTLDTPAGRAERILGGSASYFALAASYFTDVNMVGVVGDDFGPEQLKAFEGRRIDLTGLERASGKTFHWQGKYSTDLNSRETICTDLNVFENFKPKLPPAYRESDRLFLGNIEPTLQRDVLDQVESPRLVGCDTMNLWINHRLDELKKTLAKVEILLINDSEAKELAADWNVIRAARAIRDMGPKTLIIKKGEHGALLFHGDSCFIAPAYPLEKVKDPTGAGDSFAGGFMGYLDQADSHDDATLRQAVIMGSTVASFCCEDFGVARYLTLTPDEIRARFGEFASLVHFDRLPLSKA